MHVSVPQKKSGVPIVPWSELADIEMVSFDVFDTLLFRRSGTPHDFFGRLGREAIDKELWPDGDANAFTELRILAENRARRHKFEQSGHREVTLREIYQAWPQVDAEKMCELETNLELADWHINDAMVSWVIELHQAGFRLAILSDMYLEKSLITGFLECHLSMDWFEQVLISGEVGCSKHDGGLFRMLLERCQLAPSHIVHVGDNAISDRQMACSNGLNGYVRELDYINNITRFERRLTPIAPLSIDATRRQWAWKNATPTMAQSVGALIYGPFLWGVACWLLQRCKALGVTHLYCLLREGDILAEVLSIVNRDCINISTLAISRRASWLPSLPNVDIEVLELLCQRRAYTLAECLEDLNLSAQKNWQSELSSELKAITSTPIWDELKQVFLSNLKNIKKHLDEQRKLLNKYLAQQGVVNSSQVALVDWGCGASLFNNICKITPLANARFFMAYASQKSKSFALEYALESFFPSANHWAQTIAESPEISEILLNGELYSTRAYKSVLRTVVPIHVDATFKSQPQSQRLKEFRQSVLSFCQLAKCSNAERDEVSISQRSALSAILYRFIQYPLTEEAKSFSEMSVPLSGKEVNPLVSKNSITQIVKHFSNINSAYGGVILGNYQTHEYSYWLPAALAIAFPATTGLYGELAHLAGNEVVAPMLLQQLQQNGINRTVIYGAGELGVDVLHLLIKNNIEISYFVDRRAESGPFVVDGVGVITFTQAMDKGERVFAIASRAYVNEIKRDIVKNVGDDIKNYTILLISGVVENDE